MSTYISRFRPYAIAVALLAVFCSILVAQDATGSQQDVPEPQMQPAPSAPPNAIAQGTVLLVQLADRIDTRTVKAGDRFHARLAEPVTVANGMTLEEGAKIKGHVSAVLPGLHTRIILSFDDIQMPHGHALLMATVTGVPGEHGLRAVGDEGEIGRAGMTKQEIAEAVIVAAGQGAVEGDRTGGKKGAAAGAGNGAADAAYAAFESGHDLILDSGTALEIRLDHNLTLR